MSRDQYPTAAKVIVNNSYVDDILGNCDNYEMASSLMKEIELVTAQGRFKIRQWILSGDHSSVDSRLDLAEIHKEKVLGVVWEPKRDVFVFRVKINFSPKHRKVHTGSDLKPDDLASEMPQHLTKRMLLRQIATQFDPLGLVCPVTLKAKLMLRRLVSPEDTANGESRKYNWDDVVSPQIRNEWLNYFQMFNLDTVVSQVCKGN